jgi:hypothetical protein
MVLFRVIGWVVMIQGGKDMGMIAAGNRSGHRDMEAAEYLAVRCVGHRTVMTMVSGSVSRLPGV